MAPDEAIRPPPAGIKAVGYPSQYISPRFTCVNDNPDFVLAHCLAEGGRMSKEQPCIVVAQQQDGWTLRFSGRSFDRFASREEAVERALEWARNAGKQGQAVSVLLEDGDGQRTPVWPASENVN